MSDEAQDHSYDVRSSITRFTGRIIGLRSDEVAMPGGDVSARDYVVHPGAVGVVALDSDDRVLLVRQYRHPVRRRLEELPAGLLDEDGEAPHTAAARELVEEAGLAAGRWDVLVDAFTSPGSSDEAIRLYLARDVSTVERPKVVHEEAEMTSRWVPLDDAVRSVFAGEIENAMCCIGVLAVERARRDGFAGLRAIDAPWPARNGEPQQ